MNLLENTSNYLLLKREILIHHCNYHWMGGMDDKDGNSLRFGLVQFYGISNIIRLFNAKSFLYIY